MKNQPYGFEILTAEACISPFDNHIERRLSGLRGLFANQTACDELIASGDPLVYEVYENRQPEIAGELLSGLSIVHPGRIGSEYFMTKGHYHSVRDTAEIYYCLEGQGLLLTESEDGECRTEEFRPGRVVYVSPRWAHRSINLGEGPLITFFVYPANAGHDYATIERTGFRKRILSSNDGPVFVDSQDGSQLAKGSWT